MSELGAQAAPFPRAWSPYRFNRTWLIILLITALVLGVGGILASRFWPYRYAQIHPLLEDMFGNRVFIGKYHRTYFPNPGFVATGITITHRGASNSAPLGTIETLSVEGRWRDLFLLQRRVRLVEITQFRLMIPPLGSASSTSSTQPQAGSNAGTGSTADQFEGPTTAIETLRIYNSVLEFKRAAGGSYKFAIRELDIGGLQKGKPWRYAVDMENPLPAGHIAARGSFGPLNKKDVGVTPVSGQFTFNEVKLSDIGDLRGKLASSGHFQGPLRAIEAEANSDTPDFAVDDGQPTHLRGYVRCTVNGLNGDVLMPRVEVSAGKTIVHASGQVIGSPKLSNFDIDMPNGRAEEVLRPFIHDRVPIIGPATLHSHAFVAAPGKPFLERLRLDGSFTVPAEKMTDSQVERTLSDFSRREQANSHDPQSPSQAEPKNGDVLSSLSGPATIRNGVISTPGLVFRLPGALANLHGTFALHGEVVHMTGTLKMDAGISHAATGWKSILLKPLQPFFHRKDRSGSEVPIAVVGSPGHYHVAQNISHNK